jgi:hypothetical protein
MRPTTFTITLVLLAALALGARLMTRTTSAASHPDPITLSVSAN